MIVYDLRKNIKQQQLGKNGAFWNWLGNFFGTVAEKSPEILNSIYGGATSDTITYVTNPPATNANNATDYNKYRNEKDNTLLYVGIGAVVVLGAVVIMTNNNSRDRRR